MNNKNSIDSLKRVVHTLENDKKKLMVDMKNLKAEIDRKIQSVNKIIQYKDQTERNTGNQMRFQIPALYQNMGDFSKKIDRAIYSGQIDIDDLEKRKIKLIQNIQELDNKIDTLKSLIEKQEKEIRILDENREIEKNQDLITQIRQE